MYIKFVSHAEPVEGSVSVTGNVATLKFKEGIVVNASGFRCYMDKEMKYNLSGEAYLDFKTVYRNDDETQKYNGYQLSNDGSVYKKPIPLTTFYLSGNGQINGKKQQSVYRYEELEIPTVQVDTGYKFVGWSPEIPSEGEIEENVTFRAIVVDNNIYFHSSGGGVLNGELKQSVNNYSELVIPTPTPDANYKFVSWMPEIPKSGEIDSSNTNFYAVFESNIPDRVKTVESDLTDTQLGLVENYESLMAASQEVTDLQLALVEVYNLITGGK